jgi:hypothetical protein
MDEGTKLEPIILNLLYEKHNFSFAYGSQFQVELNLGAWNGKTLIVRGKVDEIGAQMPPDAEDRIRVPKLDNLPIDVKAFTEDDVAKYRLHGLSAFPRYEWQQSAYALGYGSERVYMPIFHKGTWKIEPFSLDPIKPPYSRDDIRDRVLQVEEAFAEGKMPELCPADFACPYPYLHDAKPVDEVPEDAIRLIQARITLSKRISSLDEARKALDTALKNKLKRDVAYHLDGYTVSVFANPRRFNTDAAKRLLTEAEIDWEHEDEYWIPGAGEQIRFTPPKKPAKE